MAYSDEYLLSISHLGEAVVGKDLRAEIVACQARTKAQDASSTVLGPAILGTSDAAGDARAPKKPRAKQAA